MLSSLPHLLASLALLLPLVAASPLSASPLSASPLADPNPCTAFPAWSITDFSSSSSDSVGAGGKASFKLTNSLTAATDTITCNLQVNYRCVISGTPTDKNLIVQLALRAGTLTLQLDRVVGDCPGRTGPLHVIGNGELALECIGEGHGATVTCALEEKQNIIQGEPIELAPER